MAQKNIYSKTTSEVIVLKCPLKSGLKTIGNMKYDPKNQMGTKNFLFSWLSLCGI